MTPITAAQQGISAQRGAWVKSVSSGGGAESAGILAGDVIVAIDGVELDNVKDLQQMIRGYGIGDDAVVTLVRGDDTRTFLVTLQELGSN